MAQTASSCNVFAIAMFSSIVGVMVNIAGIEIFDFFCSCDLYLDQMTFIYELGPYFLEIYMVCKYELSISKLSKVIV